TPRSHGAPGSWPTHRVVARRWRRSSRSDWGMLMRNGVIASFGMPRHYWLLRSTLVRVGWQDFLMLETSARLLRPLSLLPAKREWTGGELAERLEITPRTVRRDVEKLRGLGYLVEATPGVAGGYRLGRGASVPPLLLDDEEAVAVAVGLRTAA